MGYLFIDIETYVDNEEKDSGLNRLCTLNHKKH